MNKLITLIFLFSVACSQVKQASDQDFWKTFKKNNPWEYSDYYHNNSKNLADKFYQISENQIAYIKRRFKSAKHLKMLPEVVTSKAPSFSWFQKEIRKMPKKAQQLLQNKVIGWTLVKNLGASGTFIPLRDSDNYNTKGILVIDTSIYKKSFKEICSYKEGTTFHLNQEDILSCYFKNTKISFLTSIIYHEAGHVFHQRNPFYTDYLTESGSVYYPFNRISWRSHDKKTGNNLSKYDDTIPDRVHLRYYTVNEKDLIENNKISKHLEGWQNSSFLTLYSMAYPSEDWAETFMMYFIKKFHRGVYEVSYNGKKYKSCINKELCERKYRLMDVYFKNPDLFNISED